MTHAGLTVPITDEQSTILDTVRHPRQSAWYSLASPYSHLAEAHGQARGTR
ncbi:MAG: hypothetical protein QOG22_1792 [Pseudonocardiales bacterium]|nr:hypothetical protein [Pseudonocardiales bacterium]